jgi:GNAT superfamily N-acetyltransferase
MNYRIATPSDIKELFEVRMSVKENVLMNTDLVTDELCEQYLTQKGKGWVCETDGKIVGFAIADIENDSIWALFIRPEYEGRGIGRKLQDIMLNWYFSNNKEQVWLTTAPNSRAERFYRTSGWVETGWTKNGEIRFELTRSIWDKNSPAS